MVDLALRRSALSGWERKLANSDIDGICTLREIPFLGMANVRLDLSGRGAAKAVEEAQREFYATMVTAGALEKDLLAEVMNKIIPSATTIRLIPFRPRPDMHTLHGRYTTVLAAMTLPGAARG